MLNLAKQAAAADILVNNAATLMHLFPITEAHDDLWELAFAVDFWAPLLLMRELGQNMQSRGRGSIINVSSMVTKKLTPMTATYGTSKSALDALSKVAAMELAPHGVRQGYRTGNY